jgi:hypothetical protein
MHRPSAAGGRRAVVWSRWSDKGPVKGVLPDLMDGEAATWLTIVLNQVSPDTIYLQIPERGVPDWLSRGYRPRWSQAHA